MKLTSKTKWRNKAKQIIINGIQTQEDAHFICSLVDGIYSYDPHEIYFKVKGSNSLLVRFGNPRRYALRRKYSNLKDMLMRR